MSDRICQTDAPGLSHFHLRKCLQGAPPYLLHMHSREFSQITTLLSLSWRRLLLRMQMFESFWPDIQGNSPCQLSICVMSLLAHEWLETLIVEESLASKRPVDDVGSWHGTWRKQTSEVDEEGTSQETTLFGVLSLRADTAIINRQLQGSSKLPPSYVTGVQSASCLMPTEYFQKRLGKSPVRC